MIAIHPDVQKRAQAEVDEVFASLNGAPLTYGGAGSRPDRWGAHG